VPKIYFGLFSKEVRMPSQRAILANIHDLNLDPKKPHTKLSKKGSLALEIEKNNLQVQEQTVLASKIEEEETLELTQEQQQDLLESVEQQAIALSVAQPAEKKNKKGFQKKSNKDKVS
jgi:hypothetical protein